MHRTSLFLYVGKLVDDHICCPKLNKSGFSYYIKVIIIVFDPSNEIAHIHGVIVVRIEILEVTVGMDIDAEVVGIVECIVRGVSDRDHGTSVCLAGSFNSFETIIDLGQYLGGDHDLVGGFTFLFMYPYSCSCTISLLTILALKLFSFIGRYLVGFLKMLLGF